MVDDEGVSAFCGYNESAKLKELYVDSKILSVKEAAQLISEKLAPQLKVIVDTISLEYLPYYDAEYYEKNSIEILCPCWKVTGHNTIKNEKIQIFLDVFNGEIYYYTQSEEQEEDE
ncbi:hypothetical protein P261_00005 [Lachnospiraceae bacterium TWA4]|nr:hypothetical protein P261_00005 [Lachnospiraceae bacterium TWA4]